MTKRKPRRSMMRCSITIEIALPAKCLSVHNNGSKDRFDELSALGTRPKDDVRHEHRQESLAAILKDVLQTWIGGVSEHLAQAEPSRIHLRLAEAPAYVYNRVSSQIAESLQTTSAFAYQRDRSRNRVRDAIPEDLAKQLASFSNSATRRKVRISKFARTSPQLNADLAKTQRWPVASSATTSPSTSCKTPLHILRRPSARVRLRRRAIEIKASQRPRASTWRLTRRRP